MTKITPRHYWAIATMGQIDTLIRDDPNRIAEAWDVLFPERKGEFWDVEFQEFLEVIVSRVDEISARITEMNDQIARSRPMSLGDWMGKPSD